MKNYKLLSTSCNGGQDQCPAVLICDDEVVVIGAILDAQDKLQLKLTTGQMAVVISKKLILQAAAGLRMAA